MKLIASWVEVPPVELDGSRPNHCTRDEAARLNQKRVRMELSGRNEGELHQMSLEMHKSGKPSRCVDGEDCHAASSNRQPGAVDSGGVSEDDTTGRSTQISWESSRRGAGTAQLPVQGGHPAKTGPATGAVGVLRSSDEPAYSKGAGERREGTWDNVNANSAGSGDGRSAEETLFERIRTPIKIQKLQRTLYRKANSNAMNDPRKAGCGKTACPV